jgi:thiamine biosynthesis protein ThiI
MERLLLVKYAEIHLKGLNRPFFERALLEGLRRAVRDVQPCRVEKRGGRYYLEGYDIRGEEALVESVRRVFGVHSVCPAVRCEKETDAIAETACALMRTLPHEGASFKVLVRRADKRYPIPSMELAAELGGRLLARLDGLRVDVSHPDILLSVEIRDEGAYLYVREIAGYGGMPLGTAGRAALLLSGGIDSPVAGWMMMKRGVRLIAVHFYSFPYTGELARQKVLDLAAALASFGGKVPVHVVPFTAIQEALYERAPEELMTLLMRRAMMRIAERIARKNGCGALVTGESLGQVASQTMEGLQVTQDGIGLPVLRPLIGFDKAEIVDRARAIGTFDISSRPYEDCCTVFTPRHPSTRPRLETVRAAEAAAGLEQLIQDAVDGTVMEIAGPD